MRIPRNLLCGLAVFGAVSFSQAKDHTVHTFKKIQLTDKFWAEGANFGDFNHDGKVDVVYGPFWYEGPDFKIRHEYYPANHSFKLKKADGTEETIEGFEGGLGVNNTYSDNFFAFSYDFNHDGWDDILILGFPGQDASWYENPHGKKAADGTEHWVRHKIFDVVDDESPTFADVDGDGKPDIICCSGGFVGYVTADWADAAKPWKFHAVSPSVHVERFTHGIGYGDVNGDGRTDLLMPDGWYEHPASLAGDPQWKFHPFKFADGGSHMFAYDVNGDGKNDVITSLQAHGYGVVWWEQTSENGEISFKQHVIVGKTPADSKYGIVFSQPHAIDLVDIDGDGLKDIVTGKRFWAHGSHGDADPSAPAVLYWFQLVRGPNHEVDWVPHLIDDNSGIGTQVIAGRCSNKKLPDIVVGNKHGAFVFEHQTKKVSEEEWKALQPKVVNP